MLVLVQAEIERGLIHIREARHTGLRDMGRQPTAKKMNVEDA